jgi:hypothetical protein
MARHVGQHPESRFEAVLHHHHVEVAQVAARPGAGGGADEVDGVVEFLGGLCCRPLGPLVEER